MRCIYCNELILESEYRKYCNKKCYQKHYYELNKEKRTAYFKKHHKETYIAHPLPRVSEEDKLARRKRYYEEHKDYYRQKNKAYYEKHKHDPEYVRKHIEANIRYQRRRRQNNALHKT